MFNGFQGFSEAHNLDNKSQEWITDATNTAAGDVSRKILEELERDGGHFNSEEFKKELPGIIAHAEDKFTHKCSFPPVSGLIKERALELIVLKKSQGDLSIKQLKKYEDVEDDYLELVGQIIIKESLENSEDFYVALSAKLRDLKKHGLELNNEKIEKLKDGWYQEYFQKSQTNDSLS